MAIAKGLNFYVNGVSLACALQSFEATSEAEALDATTLCNTARKYVQGLKNATVSTSGIWDADSTNLDEIHNVYSSAFETGNQADVLATLATASVGTDAILFKAASTSYNIEIENGALVICSTDFQTNEGVGYGKVLFTQSVNGTTVTGSSVDNGAATSNGGLFVIQIQNPNQYAGTVKLEQSSNNSTWAEIASFTLAGTKFDSETIELSGSIAQYLRVKCTASTGAITFTAGVARR